MNAPNLKLETLIDETNAEFTPGGEGAKARAELCIFRPSWDNKPEHVEPCLLLGGERILSPGNLSVLIAQPGAGKSAVCEAILSGSIKPDCDSLGLSVRQGARAVYFDTERSIQDHWHSWQRMARRAGLEPGAGVPVTFELLSLFSSIGERREYIETFLQSGAADLVIIDGLGDLVESVNDEEICNACINLLLSHAKRFNIGLLATIHHNPQPGNEKARGHLGSEAMRRAESVLIIKRDTENGVRTITTDFQHGKNRNASDRLESCFTWNEEAQMFLSCARPEKKPAARERQAELIEALRAGKTVYTFTDLIEAIMKHTKKSEDAAKGIYRRLKNAGKLVPNGDLWGVISNESV
jgi:hypothetical protein